MWMHSVCLVLGLLWGVGEAILTNGSGLISAGVNNTGPADKLTSQETNQRSTVYGEYYPEDLHGSDGNYGYGYGHHNGYQPHPYPATHPHDPHHQYDVGLKTLLIPLAGVALLGAAALFASNPILLQLGVVSGKRRKRSVTEEGRLMSEQRFQDILMLEKFISQVPQEEVVRQERRLLAVYLHCSDTPCVERLACELYSTNAPKTERHLMDMVISEIVNNEFIKEEIKKNIVKARRIGHIGGDCNSIPCPELDKITKVDKE